MTDGWDPATRSLERTTVLPLGCEKCLFGFALLLDHTGASKKNPAKFSDSCSVRADGLCIGSPRLVVSGWEEGGKFKHARIFFAPGCTVMNGNGLI